MQNRILRTLKCKKNLKKNLNFFCILGLHPPIHSVSRVQQVFKSSTVHKGSREDPQPAFTSSRSTMETPEQYEKSV